MEIERKWLLLDPPSPEELIRKGARALTLTQTYLSLDHPGTHRVRHTQEASESIWEFVTKIPLTTGINDETTYSLHQDEYENFLKSQDPSRRTVHKTRYVLALESLELESMAKRGHENDASSLSYEFDYFTDPDGLRVLEIEFSNPLSIGSTWTPPSWIGECRDVTSDKSYSNHTLALKGIPAPPRFST